MHTCRTQKPNNSLAMSLMLSLQGGKNILSEQQKSLFSTLSENGQKPSPQPLKRLSFRSYRDLSLSFKAKRAFCSATFMSYFSPSLLCPLLLGILPASLLRIQVPFEQPFWSSSWERKTTLLSYLFPFPISSTSLSAQQIASVELPCVSGGRAAGAGGRDDRSTSAPPSTRHVSKNTSRHLGKSRASGGWVQRGGKVLTPCLKG